MELMGFRNGAFYIGDTRYIASSIVHQDIDFRALGVSPENLEDLFRTRTPTSRIRQAKFDFDTGWTVSIIWGTAANCENYQRGMMNDEEFKELVSNVEISLYHQVYEISIDPVTRVLIQGPWVQGVAEAAQVRAVIYLASELPEPLGIADAAEPTESTEDLPDEDF